MGKDKKFKERSLEAFKESTLGIMQEHEKFLQTLIIMLEDTYLNIKDKRIEFAAAVRKRLDFVHHFVKEEIRIQKEEKNE